MKKKMIAVIGLSLVVTANSSNIAYAAPSGSAKVSNKSSSETNTQDKDFNIEFYSNLGQQALKLDFNPQTMKIEMAKQNDKLGNGQNTYMRLFLYNSKNNKVEVDKSILDGNTQNLSEILNGKSFNYGDVIGIDFKENYNPKTSDGINIPNNNKMNYYKITKKGMVPYTPDVVVNQLKVTNGSKEDALLTGSAKPNTKILVKIDGESFSAEADNSGDFNIKVNDKNGFNEKTVVNVTMQSEIGAITENIKPILIKKPEIKKPEKKSASNIEKKGQNIGSKTISENVDTIRKATNLQSSTATDEGLLNSKIQVINDWGSSAGCITFNPNTMEFNVSQYNEYLGKNSNDFLNIKVYNPSKYGVLYSANLKGNDNTSALKSLLNGKKFAYGDIIEISYDNSQGKVQIDNGNENEMNTDGKTESFEITKDGIIKSTLEKVEVNPFDVLGSSSSITSGTLTGKTTPNNVVNVTIGNEKFTGNADANGKFSILIKDDAGFTNMTEITVWAENQLNTVVKPSIKSGIVLQNSNIELMNQWNNCAGGIKFNPATMKMKTYENYSELNIGTNVNISIYSNETGKVLSDFDANANTTATKFNEAFDGKSFAYGDILKVTTDSSSAIKLLNGTTNLNAQKGTSEYQLTKAGLVPYVAKLKVNPLQILNGQKVVKATLTGQTDPGKKVTATIDGKSFEAVANAKGEYSIPITDDNGFEASTIINVFAPNEGIVKISPTLDNSIKIQNNEININNVWNMHIGTVKFNPITKKIEFVAGSAGINPYLPKNSEAFGIYMYDESGKLLNSMKVYGSTYPEKDLATFFNNVPYKYGDIIRIDYKTSSQVTISNFDNQKSYRVAGNNQFQITKDGFKKVNLQTVNVNAFNILGSSNNAVTSGTLTGKTLKPNATVNIEMDNKNYTTKSNAKGEYSIKLTNSSGFESTTKISVSTQGELTNVIYPVAVTNLGISQSKLQLNDNSLGIAQTMTFDPATMEIINTGNSFAGQLIDQTTGKVKASLSTGNFNAFTSKNDLNGAKFRYGDIISIYESEETSLSDGKVMLINGKKTTDVDAISKFVSFEITPQGLVQVQNKELSNVSALFKGNSVVNVTGKTSPNTAMKLYYGNNKEITITSNKEGVFSTDIPLEDANVGSEVRIFINNKNLKNVVVKYDSKMFNTNNSIQIINNEAFPVINITFSPATSTIQSLVYPRDKTYAGVFYGNRMNISILNPKTGEVLKSVTSKKAGEIQSFSDELNNFKYTQGDIVKIQYDKNLVSANVIDNKKQIGNTTGASEYFEITNKGLINITNKFISVQPLNILGNGKVTKATVTGKASPNKVVTATINGEEFKAAASASGEFSINIQDNEGFTNKTTITLSADGYIPSTIKPSVSQNLQLVNSYVNFYQNSFNSEATSLCSSIGFDVENNTFFVNNYKDSFGTGSSNYFSLYLYNSQGKVIDSKAFTGKSTSDLSTFINGKTFKYGDVIGLKYNPDIYKPMVVNANTVIGNISGEMEYFKITKDGLVRVDFGNSATTKNIAWNGSSLNISANIATGNSESILNADKKIVLVNSDNKILASENATTKMSDGNVIVSGSLNSSDLAKIKANESYNIGLDINGTIMPLYVDGNVPNSDMYLLSGSSRNKLGISLKNKNYVTLNNATQISSYLDGIIKNVSNISTSTLTTNLVDQNQILAAEFITRIGAKNIEALYSKSSENANFINWVLNNSNAMQEFLSGPSPAGHTPEGQPKASYSECLQVWSNIWNTYTNSHTGFNLKLAIATALSNGGTIHAFPSGRPVGSPVERYNIFETLNANGGMLPEFKTLDVSHLCYITNVPIANDQIIPMRNIILQNHNGLVKENALNNIAYTIHYNLNNPHTGASVFGPNFYGNNPRIKTVWYDGGVCGAAGRMGAAGEQVFGIPAVQTPQPGHNAFIWYNAKNNSWNIGNVVDGWSETYDADMSSWSNAIAPNKDMIASYNLLYQVADTMGLTKSNLYIYLANTETTYTAKLAAINAAIKENKLNLGAWIALVNLYKSNPNTTIEQYNTLENNIIETFKEYPMPMYDLLYQLKNTYIDKGSENDFNNYVTSIKNILTKEQNMPNYGSIAKAMLGQMQPDGLVVGNVVIPGSINIQNVWEEQIGNISIDGTTKQIKVRPSGSSTNPYGVGEAFKISLEKADGTIIKSLVVNHQEAKPGVALEKEFNNVKFDFGDKIVINYVGSSNITANEIISNDGTVSSMKVNKPITTFYITKNGLSLVESGLSDKVSVPVVIKDSENKVIKQGETLTGQMGSSIVCKNLEIPTGYKLNSVLFNGSVIYTGDNETDAQFVIAQKKYAKNESIEILVNKINSINTTELQNEIVTAKAKLSSGILYTENSSNALKSAIASGQEVLKNTKSTQVQINNATENIKQAVASLAEWCNANQEITNAIDKAQQVLTNGSINGNLGYTDSSKVILTNVITNAKKLIGDPNATPTDITKAINEINNAVKGLKVNTIGLSDAIASANAKVKSGDFTSNSKNALENTIASGNKVLENASASPSEVKVATIAINNAIKTLQNVATIVQKDALTNAINEGEKTLTKGSSNGNQGYTNATSKALTKVIDAAKQMLKDPNATQSNIAKEITAINNAENALKANTNNLEKAVTVAKTKTGKYTKMSQ
ncbi:MAG: coiled-coil domain-containing protein, partial [Sarcina sp.]